MLPIWRAEIAVDPTLAKILIEAQFPVLRPVFARLLGAGWDNTAYLVNEAFIFRFPRRQVAVPLIQTEIDLLPWLSSRVPLRVPVPTYAGQPSVLYGLSWGMPSSRGNGCRPRGCPIRNDEGWPSRSDGS